MDITRLQELAEQALDCAVRGDNDGATAAMDPLFTAETSMTDALAWVMGMVRVAVGDRPAQRDKDDLAVPMVGIVLPDGSHELRPIDTAPLGVATYARLCAAWLNDDRELAFLLWQTLFLTVPEDEGEEVVSCMHLALSSAARAVRERRAGRQ